MNIGLTTLFIIFWWHSQFSPSWHIEYGRGAQKAGQDELHVTDWGEFSNAAQLRHLDKRRRHSYSEQVGLENIYWFLVLSPFFSGTSKVQVWKNCSAPQYRRIRVYSFKKADTEQVSNKIYWFQQTYGLNAASRTHFSGHNFQIW